MNGSEYNKGFPSERFGHLRTRFEFRNNFHSPMIFDVNRRKERSRHEIPEKIFYAH